MKGTPIRLGIGMRDLEKGQVEIARRDTKEKMQVPVEGVVDFIANLLEEIQANLLQKATDHQQENIRKADTFDDFKSILENHGGFISAHWDGTTETEKKIKELTKASIRCIPLDNEQEAGKCVLTGNPSSQRVLFAKAY